METVIGTAVVVASALLFKRSADMPVFREGPWAPWRFLGAFLLWVAVVLILGVTIRE